jgi:hypothetical protein
MAAFATVADLEGRLGRKFDDPAMAELALDDASEHLRGLIGQQVFPVAQATFTELLRGGEHWITLPQHPVVSVDSVTVEGSEIPFTLVDGALRVHGHAIVEVTYTFGYADPPKQLISWACVLAAQAISSVDEMGTIGSGGVSSVSIDDYRKSWFGGGDSAGYSLPQRVEEKLKSQFGSTTFVVSTR